MPKSTTEISLYTIKIPYPAAIPFFIPRSNTGDDDEAPITTLEASVQLEFSATTLRNFGYFNRIMNDPHRSRRRRRSDRQPVVRVPDRVGICRSISIRDHFDWKTLFTAVAIGRRRQSVPLAPHQRLLMNDDRL